MAKLALYVLVTAKPGKEADVEAFLKQGASMSQDEPATIAWYGLKLAANQYAVFDTFDDEAGRDAHLHGPIAKALMSVAEDYFTGPPQIHKLEILAEK